MRPFTKVDRVLSLMLPACFGAALPGVLIVAVTEPNWSWALPAAALLLTPLCARSRMHGRRRYEEINRAAEERGKRISGDGILAFNESEIDEIGLIKGQFVADAIRGLSRGVQRT